MILISNDNKYLIIDTVVHITVDHNQSRLQGADHLDDQIIYVFHNKDQELQVCQILELRKNITD